MSDVERKEPKYDGNMQKKKKKRKKERKSKEGNGFLAHNIL
jgi:hypothetical protein